MSKLRPGYKVCYIDPPSFNKKNWVGIVTEIELSSDGQCLVKWNKSPYRTWEFDWQLKIKKD